MLDCPLRRKRGQTLTRDYATANLLKQYNLLSCGQQVILCHIIRAVTEPNLITINRSFKSNQTKRFPRSKVRYWIASET
jgi:hypothetical protein